MKKLNFFPHIIRPVQSVFVRKWWLQSSILVIVALVWGGSVALAAEVSAEEVDGVGSTIVNPSQSANTASSSFMDAFLSFLPVVSAESTGVANSTESAGESFAFKLVAGKVLNTAQSLAIYALGLVGVNYKFGGNTPDAGLDCSGLVRHVFQQVTGITLPRSAKEMSKLGEKVPLQDLKPGDLVFFNTRHFQFSHVGIYLGDNKFIHAPASGGDVELVKITEPYWIKTFNGARRLVDVLTNDEVAQVAALRVQANNSVKTKSTAR